MAKLLRRICKNVKGRGGDRGYFKVAFQILLQAKKKRILSGDIWSWD
jgi:hypothetical protein